MIINKDDDGDSTLIPKGDREPRFAEKRYE